VRVSGDGLGFRERPAPNAKGPNDGSGFTIRANQRRRKGRGRYKFSGMCVVGFLGFDAPAQGFFGRDGVARPRGRLRLTRVSDEGLRADYSGPARMATLSLKLQVCDGAVSVAREFVGRAYKSLPLALFGVR
jgi:hypothetical protein